MLLDGISMMVPHKLRDARAMGFLRNRSYQTTAGEKKSGTRGEEGGMELVSYFA